MIDKSTFMSTGKTRRTLLSLALTGAGSLAVTMVAPALAQSTSDSGSKPRPLPGHARLHAEDLGSASTGAAGQRGGSSHIRTAFPRVLSGSGRIMGFLMVARRSFGRLAGRGRAVSQTEVIH